MLRIQFDRGQSPADVSRQLDEIVTKHVPFATSLALNRTAQLVRKAVVKEMQRVFDRPTPYTKNSLYIEPSNKQKLEAVVWLKDEYAVGNQGTPATKYLGPEIFGGSRNAKSHERRLRDNGLLGSTMFAVPAQGAENLLNRYGNLSGGKIKQMMSGLAINRDVGHQSNITAKSIKRNPNRGRYFIIGGSENPQGIAQRPRGGALQPFLWFVKAPHYRKRLDFFGVAEKTINENLERELIKAISYAIKTAH